MSPNSFSSFKRKKIRPDLIEIADRIDPNMDIGVQSDSSSDSSSSSSSSESSSEESESEEEPVKNGPRQNGHGRDESGDESPCEDERPVKKRKPTEDNESTCNAKDGHLNRELSSKNCR